MLRGVKFFCMQQNPELQADKEQEKDRIEQLVQNVQKGDVQSFARIYEHYVDKVYKYFFFKASQEEAFDLTENLFLKVWENIRQYQRKSGASFAAWMFRIAHNQLVDHYRVETPKAELDPQYPDQRIDVSPVFLTEQSLSRGNLKTALSKLKDPHREIITFTYINGFSNEEIAQIMNKTEGSLRVLKFRALRDLKRILEEMGIKY